jgi:hypothetical protein
MQRIGRRANMPSRPSNERNSPALNLADSQRGHTRRIHNTRGSQSGQVTVSALMDELLSIEGRHRQQRSSAYSGNQVKPGSRLPLQDSLTASSRLDKMHPLRRTAECRFTAARFLMFLAIANPLCRPTLHPEQQPSYDPRNSLWQTWMGLFLSAPLPPPGSRLHPAGSPVHKDGFLRGSGGTGGSLRRSAL